MKRFQIFKNVLKKTHTDRIIVIFLIMFLIISLLILIIEPEIKTYGDAIWYCYSVFSTAGFGDVVVTTTLGRILSIILTISTIFVVAIVTGVVVAFYNEIISVQYRISKAEVQSKLEHLEDLSKEELKELSEQIRKISKV